MTACVVDSSAAFKWFVREPGSDEMAGLLRRHRDGETTLLAPALLRIELANALRYGGLDAADLRHAMVALAGMRLEIVEADDSLLAEACVLALEHALPVYAALFLALAVARDCPLVTADRKAFARIPIGVCEVRLVG